MNEEILFEIVVKTGPRVIPLMFCVSILILLLLISLSDWLANNNGIRRSEGSIFFQQVCCLLGMALSFLICAIENNGFILGAIFLLFYLTIFFSISASIKEKNKEASENKKQNRKTYKF